MIKFTSNNDYDFSEESVLLLKDANRDLIKRASSRDLFKGKYEKTPNQEDLHIIALGAYEGTGCFFNGALVQTINGLKPIEKIEIDDLVLTHKGRYKKVKTLFREEYEGNKISLDITGMCDLVESTDNHPFLVLKADNFKSKHRCPSLLEKDVDTKLLLDEILEHNLSYIPAKDIQPGDYVITPINTNINNPIIYTEDEAYLFGYYLSEGCLTKEYKDISTKGEYKSLLFTLNNIGDKPIIEFLEGFITKNNRAFSIQKSLTSEFGARITFHHKEYAQKVLKLFGCHSTKKFIYPEIFMQSKEWKLKFLAAYFDGDGCVVTDDAANPRCIGTLSGSTASRNLAYDLQRLLGSCGITSSIVKCTNKVSNNCFGYTDHIIYQISVGGSNSDQILKYCKRLQPVAKKFDYKVAKSWVSTNYIVFKVNAISSQYTDEIKYNIEVEDDNTYIVDIVGHNSNRNCDAFLEKDCISNHHYFTKAGRAVHRHHKNKPTDPKYGNIKASAYNKKMKRIELIVGLDKDAAADILHEQETKGKTAWSMASKQAHDVCFVEGSLVETYEGLVPIEKVKEGMLVKTHLGNWKKVSNIINREYNNELYKLKIEGNPIPIIVTKHHPFFSSRNEDIYINIGKNGRKDRFDTIPTFKDKLIIPSWINIENLKKYDYISYPVSKSEFLNTNITDEYAYMCGVFLGDGHIDNHNKHISGIGITCGNHEPELKEKFIKIGSNVFGKSPYDYQPKNRLDVSYLTFWDKEKAIKIKELFGEYSYGKFISQEVIQSWPDNAKLALISGFLDTDGCVIKNKAIKISSVNYNLLYSLRTLLYSLNISCSIKRCKPGKGCFGYNKTDYYYNLFIPNFWSSVLAKYSYKALNCKKGEIRKFVMFNNGFAFSKIKNIEKIENNKIITVYNLSVEDDQSYIINGAIVHNCSWCGHIAKTEKDRCEHIPAKLGEINKEGEMCAMINPSPHWFEISYVRRPADRIGLSLGKMASVTSNILPPSYFNELYKDIYIPQDELVISKKAEDKRALLHKLAEIEKEVNEIKHKKPVSRKDKFIKEHGHKLKHSPQITDDDMNSLRSFNPASVFKSLADSGILFGPDDFSKYLFGDKGEDTAGMKSHLPNIFQKLEKDDGKSVNNEQFEPDGRVPDKLKKTVGKLREGHSLENGPVIRRMMIITISGTPKQSEPTKEASDLEYATKYAEYQLSSLNYLNENNKLTDDMLLNTILLNQ